MSILSTVKSYKKYLKTATGYQLISQWTKAKDVECEDGQNLQTIAEKVGEINGLVSTYDDVMNTTDDGLVPSAAAVKEGFNAINDKLGDGFDSEHNHDDRYYTETEVNNLLAGKSDTSHTHNYAASKSAGGSALGVSSTNSRAELWEDHEGGNLQLRSWDSARMMQMDMFNGSFRMFFNGAAGNNNALSFVTYDPVNQCFNAPLLAEGGTVLSNKYIKGSASLSGTTLNITLN